MVKRKTKYLLGVGVFAALLSGGALAAGLYGDLPGVGQPAYCASTSTGPNGPLCNTQVPAGPTTFAGTEYTNMDLGPIGGTNPGNPPQTYAVTLLQLGQGAALDVTTVGTSQTIPNNTPFYYLDGAQGSAFTVQMPAQAVEGQFQRVVCEAATVGTLTVTANTGQTVKNPVAAACVAGTSYTWRYSASGATWFRT